MRTEDNTRPGLIKEKNVFIHTRDILDILYKLFVSGKTGSRTATVDRT